MSRAGATSAWHTISVDDLVPRLARWLAAMPGLVRVALDGAPGTAPAALAEALVEPLRALGRPCVHVRSSSFWRDASLRFEVGREDVESYLTWLDAPALQREVLDAAVRGHYLASLRDPTTNRSTREPSRTLETATVLVVSGELLMGRGLPFDRTVHLTMSATALARRTEPEVRWTLPAFEQYDSTVRPSERADVVIRVDRRTPAVQRLP